MRGYSVELCTRIAADVQRALKLPQLDVQWIAVDSNSRIDAVATGRADAECGTTTITLSRMERVDFSVPIFVDGAALAVRAKSPVQRVGDLSDRRRRRHRRHDDRAGRCAPHSTLPARPRRSSLSANRKRARRPCTTRRADAFAGDRLVITQLLSRFDENALAILPDDFSFEPYGIVVRRDDPEFRLAPSTARWSASTSAATSDAIFQRWLAPLGKPSALLNAMFYLNSLPE